MKIGFDNEKYLEYQKKAILERVKRFGDKLYLEFGGKLLYDMHAARVLPGFDPNVKMRLLRELKDQADIILCIFAGDIERKKVRADFGITYDADAVKLIDDVQEWGLQVTAVVITRYDDQPTARMFKERLERRGIRVYYHRSTRGYPSDVDRIVSEEGYGANPLIETTKPLVVVTGPGPGSGKLATCLSQMYHEYRNGVNAGYAKFETFPIWNLPLNHPVNIAYEAATVDLGDCNMLDSFHLDAHGEKAVNYNRDMEAYPVLRCILKKIVKEEVLYASPTDMGVNCAGFGISDDACVREASRQEIIRRWFRCHTEYAIGLTDQDAINRIERLMKMVGLNPNDRTVVRHAYEAAAYGRERDKGNEGVYCGAAIELDDGRIITGHNTTEMHAASSVVINAIKALADIPQNIHLLPPNILESITHLKHHVFKRKSISMDLDETLIALSISATSNPSAQAALDKLPLLRDCELHLTHIPTRGDEAGLRQLGARLTSDPKFSSRNLFEP
ncbi:MAG: DUF1846 domain-containing protein [Kiritimatiellae bacterium]|nr:DUF1846 domain-containing protein [Kiritimatiellia bacterium]